MGLDAARICDGFGLRLRAGVWTIPAEVAVSLLSLWLGIRVLVSC